jgi:uncharacterized protein YcbK (DUF882 family)
MLGRPMVLTSGYRCRKHNAAVGGAANSLHCLGLAADILVPAAEQDAFADAAKIMEFAEIIKGRPQKYVHLGCPA